MRKHIRCGKLFTGLSGKAETDQTIVIEDERIGYVGPSAGAPKAAPGDELVDHSRHFVLPGLIDIHVHLAYGNCKTEEDIDLYAPVEFRALRGLEAAQRVLKAGYTSICDPATSGLVSPSIRDAIEANLFVGPRVTASGPQITNRQGLTDWYPTWIGVPSTAIGVLCKNAEEGIAEIRKEVKNGVDFIKIAMDGDAMNPMTTTLTAGYDQDEISAMTREAHRLGKKVVVHARGDEATLYAARAGVDVILHASFMTERTLEEVVKAGSWLCPSYLLVVNDIDFTRPGDGAYPGFPDAHKRELEAGAAIHTLARKAGVKYLVGTDSGFAITPYGEWHAKELEIYVKYFGFTPAEAIQAATVNNGQFVRHAGQVGALEQGRLADILVIDGDPLADIRVLQDRSRIREIFLGGETVTHEVNPKAHRLRSEFSYQMWNEVYSQARIAELRRQGTLQAAE
ncbi:MAG: amidohydrolase family protein [Alphaproteobacteria bacterium]